MRLLLLLLFSIGGLASLQAQKYLQIERVGSFKVKRYQQGEELTFRITDDDYWYTEEIVDIMIPENMVLFTNRVISVEDITHIRSFKRRKWSKPMGQQLYNFGIGWIVFSLGDALFGNPLRRAIIEVPLVAGVTGFLIQKLFRHRTFRMGKNRRLRVLDLTFSPGP